MNNSEQSEWIEQDNDEIFDSSLSCDERKIAEFLRIFFDDLQCATPSAHQRDVHDICHIRVSACETSVFVWKFSQRSLVQPNNAALLVTFT